MTYYPVNKGFSETLTLNAKYFRAQKHQFLTKLFLLLFLETCFKLVSYVPWHGQPGIYSKLTKSEISQLEQKLSFL